MAKISNNSCKVNSKLKKVLKQLVKENIKSSARKDAMYILTNYAESTVKDFLFFALSNNGNLTCLCLDYAKDKNGAPLPTLNFGNILY